MTARIDLSLPELPLRRVEEMGLKELERIRLVLRGGSVIDWRQLHFGSRPEVDRFLRVCGLDVSRPEDEAWVRHVLADAVEYLRKTFHYRVTEAVARPAEVHDLFLFASGTKDPRYRRIACIVLKVMHVIQHIEGRDLMFQLAVSEAELASLVTQKVTSVVQALEAHGLPLVKFEKSLKSRESLITKLVAKKENVAAQVYDKTRFRIVTHSMADVIPALYFLTQRLFPFNFVVPGQSENGLVSFKQLLEDFPHFGKWVDQLHLDPDYEDRELESHNLFSGASYRALNFVVDVPLRLDAFLPPPELDTRERRGRIGFMLVEFQIVDRQTALQNELGENAHHRYKQRQKLKVLRRLSRGLVVPKNPPSEE